MSKIKTECTHLYGINSQCKFCHKFKDDVLQAEIEGLRTKLDRITKWAKMCDPNKKRLSIWKILNPNQYIDDRFPNDEIGQLKAEIEGKNDVIARLKLQLSEMVNDRCKWKDHAIDCENERDVLRTRLERVRGWALKREDESVNQLWEILNGEE